MQDHYALRWFPWHLGKAGRDDVRRALLGDFDWMMAKLTGTDIQSLIADYDCLEEEADLRMIQSALHLSAHVFVRDSRQLPGQLVGRLLGNNAPAIQALLKQTSENEAWPWLRPLKRSPIAAGGELYSKVVDGEIKKGASFQ
jgi:APAF-1 helical domain